MPNSYEDWDVERAAIMEYDGGLPRHEAERQARKTTPIINRRTEKTMATMTATISSIQPPNGKGPYTLHHAGGIIKCWDEHAPKFQEGRTYEFPFYNKPYNGTDELYVGKGMIKEVTGGGMSDYQAPVPPPPAPVASNGGGRPQNTPMGVANAPQGNRERSIQAQAIIKSVIAVGGSEVDVQKWMDCHDKIVAGERVG